MNRTRPLVILVISTLCLVVAPSVATANPHRSPAQCSAALDCPAAEIDLMTMSERLQFVRSMSAGPAEAVIPGYTPRWRNIEGILEFFRDHALGTPGTWVSYVDASILEGIERGISITARRGADTFGNPGATLWAKYLTELNAGTLAARSTHDRVWSEAEQASTDHGVVLAEQIHGVLATGVEQRFFQFSQFYRLTLRTRLALLDLLSPGPGPGPQRQLTFLDWFTDVSNDTPSRHGAELAHSLAEFDLPDGAVKTTALLVAYGRSLLTDYLAETGQTS